MRDTIYTIPINDVFEPKTGCPICLMRDMLEQRSVEYVMGAAMMEPDVRIETNRVGFCECHFGMLSKEQNRLSLALILETHLDEVMEKTLGHVGKKNYTYVKDTCYICNRIDESMDKMLDTVIKLYGEDDSFRKEFDAQPFFCLTHYESLCQKAQAKLNKKSAKTFTDGITKVTMDYLKKLRENVHSFATMFDYRNSGVNENDEEVKASLDKAIEFLTSRTKEVEKK